MQLNPCYSSIAGVQQTIWQMLKKLIFCSQLFIVKLRGEQSSAQSTYTTHATKWMPSLHYFNLVLPDTFHGLYRYDEVWKTRSPYTVPRVYRYSIGRSHQRDHEDTNERFFLSSWSFNQRIASAIITSIHEDEPFGSYWRRIGSARKHNSIL